MGAWFFVEPWIEWVIGKAKGKPGRAAYAGRAAAASPATGSLRKHVEEQAKLVSDALTI